MKLAQFGGLQKTAIVIGFDFGKVMPKIIL